MTIIAAEAEAMNAAEAGCTALCQCNQSRSMISQTSGKEAPPHDGILLVAII